MVNKENTQAILERFYGNCLNYWKNNPKEKCDERESYRRALEYDIVELFNVNGGCLHDPFSPAGDVLDIDTVLDFIRYRCQDLYGNDWKEHFEGYHLVEAEESGKV